MNRAEGLVREMEEQGIDAPIDLYHTMMDGYTNIKDEEKCLIVFERLKVCCGKFHPLTLLTLSIFNLLVA